MRSYYLSIAWLCGLWMAGAALAADAPVSASVRAFHDSLLTLDTHLDTPANFARPGWDILQKHRVDEDSQVDYPRMVAGGLDGGFWAIYTAQGPRTPAGNAAARDAALLRAVEIREMVARHSRQFELALQADDAARIAAAGKRVVFISMENGYPLGQDPTLLQTFYTLGLRLFGVVHFLNNDLGDSSTDPKGAEWHGLSPLGRQLVAEANRLGIVLDASHASDDVLDQLIELSKSPILLSHSGCKAIFDHPRNVDDARLRKLAASGGVIQLNTLGAYLKALPVSAERKQALEALQKEYGDAEALTPERAAAYRKARNELDRRLPPARATFDDYMRHLLHALEVAGPEHVGIGADWDGGGGVDGLDDVSQLPKITARLLQAGYTREQIADIWSGNVLRVLRQAEALRGSPQ